MTSVLAREKSSQELWEDYLFLTKEMSKFLNKQDMDLFFELMEQRDRLQKTIEKVEDDNFYLSVPGKQLLQGIQSINQHVILKLQYMMNNTRNQRNRSNAYDTLGADFVGKRMDWQT